MLITFALYLCVFQANKIINQITLYNITLVEKTSFNFLKKIKEMSKLISDFAHHLSSHYLVKN